MTTILDIQKRLLALGYSLAKFGVDGKKSEGGETDAAIRAFQAAVGLFVDGKAGPQTQTALARAVAPVKPGRPEPDKSAMTAPPPLSSGEGHAAAPPNVASLKLLDTARPIKELIWHCTATPEGKDYTVDDIRAWHKQRGWSDIGYHYVVYRDGRIMLGRPVGQVGAHVEGHNTGTIGCSYVGGVSADGKSAKDTRTAAQRASMLWLTQQLRRKFAGIVKVSGHNQYAAKACPSFDVRKDALGKII
jgi:N-acetylmuramoyl-L-alanine amidase